MTKLTHEQIRDISHLVANGATQVEVARRYGVSVSAIGYHLSHGIRDPQPGRRTTATSLAPPPSWTDQALCAETDPEIFYPENGSSPLEAKGVCGTCEVRAACLTYALTVPAEHDWGVWGGLTRGERLRLRQAAA